MQKEIKQPPKHDYDAMRLDLEQSKKEEIQVPQTPAITQQPTELRKTITYLDDNGQPIKQHYKTRQRTVWEDPTPTVVPGLAPDIQHILAQQKMGIPVNIATRTIETYFKNQDLTDIAEMSNAYAQLASQIQEKQQTYKAQMQKQREKQAQDAQRITQYLDQQNKQQHIANLQKQMADQQQQIHQI